MYTTELLRRLRNVKRNGKGHTALCPAHDDKVRSLSVREAGHKILLHCFAGCSVKEVCAALGIEVADLFTDHHSSNPRSRVVAEYDYRDEKGNLLYQVVRYDPKDFRVRRPNGHGWIWNLDGVSRVLYRLPELVKASSVLIPEGEKDVESARRLGFDATCNSGGAGKWCPEYGKLFSKKHCYVLADADEPGRRHAEQVAQSLLGKAEQIRVLELPGAKDLSEWIGHGGDRDQLQKLLVDAPPWKSSSQGAQGAQSADGFVLTSIGELLARPEVPVEYVLDGILVAGTVSEVIAKPKVGKSTLARNLSLAVSRGDDFLGRKTKQGEVIYLALEERAEDVTNDFRAMGADGTEPIFVHTAAAPAEGIAKLGELLKQRRPALAVSDPLFRLAHVKDEKGYSEIYNALGPLIDIARETGTHLLLPHHARKAPNADPVDSPLGSIGLAGVASTIIVLKRTENRRSVQTVQRIGQDLPETVLEFDPETRTLSLGAEKAEAEIDAAAEAILGYLKGLGEAGEPKTEDEILEAAEEGKTGVKRKALRRLVDKKEVARSGAGRKGNPFKYQFSFPRSPHIPGTRERESEKPPQTPINTGDILVPGEHGEMVGQGTRIQGEENENIRGSGTPASNPDHAAGSKDTPKPEGARPTGQNGNSAAEWGQLFVDAAVRVVQAGSASVSDLMYALGVSRADAIRLIDELEDGGHIGPANGSGPRPVRPPTEPVNAADDAEDAEGVFSGRI